MLLPLDVIWIPDATIKPPGPKMVVCVEPACGFFFRINTEPKWQQPVKLVRVPDHLFLKHDSYLECGAPLDLDDFIVEEAVRQSGVIGKISKKVVVDIIAAVHAAKAISNSDRELICACLNS
jgi:hypothetical protein